MEPTYHLEGIIQTKEEMADFEGPLNLILMLLSKNKIAVVTFFPPIYQILC